MCNEEFSRTELLFGKESMEKLKNSKVAIFGIGGVGSYVLEAIARSGVGFIDIIDNDVVSLSNINRQLVATHKTVGLKKVDVAKDRVLDINPSVNIKAYDVFYSAENSNIFDYKKYDYIIDAIDSVSSKIELIINAKKNDVPIICSMGTGNKLNPCDFEITDISKTSVCPLAKVMRYELKKRNIKNVKVLYSKENPIKRTDCLNENKRVPASNSFVPSVAGLIIAGEIIKDLISKD